MKSKRDVLQNECAINMYLFLLSLIRVLTPVLVCPLLHGHCPSGQRAPQLTRKNKQCVNMKIKEKMADELHKLKGTNCCMKKQEKYKLLYPFSQPCSHDCPCLFGHCPSGHGAAQLTRVQEWTPDVQRGPTSNGKAEP